MAGAEGFEPSKYQVQSLVTCRLVNAPKKLAGTAGFKPTLQAPVHAW